MAVFLVKEESAGNFCSNGGRIPGNLQTGCDWRLGFKQVVKGIDDQGQRLFSGEVR
jgi:hypothetical protein